MQDEVLSPGDDESTAPRNPPTPHDQLIKTLLEAFFPELLELVDPTIARRTLSEDEQARYAIELAAERGQEVRAMQLTWAEKHYYRGWDEGLDEGRKEGELEGMRKTLRNQIEHRLGALSEAQQRRLGAIRDAETLDELARRLLDARSVAELGLDRD